MIQSWFRRWSVPSVAVTSMAFPLMMSRCEYEFFFGEDGCQECRDCYEEYFGEPPPDYTDIPTLPPPIPEGGEEDEDTETGLGYQPPRRLPDGVTRPHIDPNLRGNESRRVYDPPRPGPTPGGSKY